MAGEDRRSMLATLPACMTPAQLIELQQATRKIHAAPALIDYVQAIAAYTRAAPDWHAGLSPRAALGLLAAARAWALLAGRDHVLPEDVQIVLPGIVEHRLRPVDDRTRLGAGDTPSKLIEAVPLP